MRRRALLLAVAVPIVAVAAALGPWAQADPEAGPPTLPTLPPVAEQVEGLYDADGCLRTGATEVDCSVRADDLDAALAEGGVGETRQLAGFVGSRWLGQVSGRGPVVLEPTIAVGAGPGFAASGLVRNEGEQVLASIAVEARLLDRDGGLLDVVEATSPVHDLRPGEPAPFRVTSPVEGEAVARVDWTARGGAVGEEAHRALSWTPYWERPAGGPPVEIYLHRDAAGARPYLLFGAVASIDDRELERPEVVVAWLDAGGVVRALTSTPVRGADGTPVVTGVGGDALVVRHDDPPQGGEALVWVQGS